MQFPPAGPPGVARTICEQEMALIDTAIWQEKISFPARIARQRPKFTAGICRAAPEPGPERRDEALPASSTQPGPIWARIPVVRQMIEHAGQARVTPLLDQILQHVGA